MPSQYASHGPSRMTPTSYYTDSCSGRKPHPPDNKPQSHLQYTPLMGLTVRRWLFLHVSLGDQFIRRTRSALVSLERASLQLPRPSRYSVHLGFALEVTRSNADLVAENALLGQQLIILHRQVDKPRFTPADRFWLVLLSSRVLSWKEALLILKPDALLCRQRQGF